MGFLSDVFEVVGSALGINEITPSKQREKAEREIREHLRKETNKLKARLTSSNAKERMEAEAERDRLIEYSNKELSGLNTQNLLKKRELEKEHKVKMDVLTTDTTKPTPEFDRAAFNRRRRRAIQAPSISPRNPINTNRPGISTPPRDTPGRRPQ